MHPHGGIHRGSHQDPFPAPRRLRRARGIPGADDGEQEIIGHAAGDLGERVGRQGRDQEQIRPASQFDM